MHVQEARSYNRNCRVEFRPLNTLDIGAFIMTKRLSQLSMIMVCSLTAETLSAHGANEKNPYIVHRQGIYGIASGHMLALKSIIMLEHPATTDITYHAKAMLGAFKRHGDAFPKGSDLGTTHAKSNVWTQQDDFANKERVANQAIEQLISAAEQNDKQKIKQTFADVSQSCKNCHDDYRKKGTWPF